VVSRLCWFALISARDFLAAWPSVGGTLKL